MANISDHPYRIIIIGGLGSGKTNTLINLINEQKDIDQIYLYARELGEPKYEYFIKNRKDAEIKHVNNPNAFIEYSNTMHDVYDNIDDYNSNRRRKILIILDEMIVDIMKNKNILCHNQRIVYQMQKTKYFTCFYYSVLFFCSKRFQIKFNTSFNHEKKKRKKLQNIAINNSADIDYKEFMKIYRECMRQPFNFLTIDTTLPASNPLRFRKNLFDSYKNDSN